MCSLARVDRPLLQVYNETLHEFPKFPAILIKLLETEIGRCVKEDDPAQLTRDAVDQRFIDILLIARYITTIHSYLASTRHHFAPHTVTIFIAIARIGRMLEPEGQSVLTQAVVRGKLMPGLVALAKETYHLVKDNLPGATLMYERLMQHYGSTVQGSMLGIRLLSEISGVQRLRRCMNLSCPPTINGTSAGSRYAKCLLYTYCSKACQQSGWKHPRYPHKTSCKKLSALQAVWEWNTHPNIIKHLPNAGPDEDFDGWVKGLASTVGVGHNDVVQLVREIHGIAEIRNL